MDSEVGGLHASCLALAQDDFRVVWFGSDLVGSSVSLTDSWRAEVAKALGLVASQIIWSTSQTHSSGATPGSPVSGSSITKLATEDSAFIESQRQRLVNAFIEGGRQALDQL